jgi:hypothetical protein
VVAPHGHAMPAATRWNSRVDSGSELLLFD